MQGNIPSYRLIIPEHMPTVRDLLQEAGWPAVFDVGVSEPTHPFPNELNRGRILGPIEGHVIQIRSMDMLKLVSGKQFDAMVIGSDCVEERFSPKFVELFRLPLGRKWNAPRPRLELVALEPSSVQRIEDVQNGSLISTERLKITQSAFEQIGRQVLVEGSDEDPEEFKQRLVETQSIGLREILGDGPVQLGDPDSEFLVIVSESGDTVRDYELKVISKLLEIDTLLITRKEVQEDPTKREAINRMALDLENAYLTIKRESEATFRRTIER